MPSCGAFAGSVDGHRTGVVGIHDPLRDAHDVRAAVANLAAAEIEQPAKRPVGVFRVVGDVARGSEPGLVVEFRGRSGVRRPVAGGAGVVPAGDPAHGADLAVADIGAGMIGGGLRASLSADLHHAPVAFGSLHHGAAFFDGQTRRLLDVDVLAGLARHHGHQGVPVIGRGDEDRVHVLVFEQPAEVLVQFGMTADARGRFVETCRIDVAQSDGARGTQRAVAGTAEIGGRFGGPPDSGRRNPVPRPPMPM